MDAQGHRLKKLAIKARREGEVVPRGKVGRPPKINFEKLRCPRCYQGRQRSFKERVTKEGMRGIWCQKCHTLVKCIGKIHVSNTSRVWNKTFESDITRGDIDRWKQEFHD